MRISRKRRVLARKARDHARGIEVLNFDAYERRILAAYEKGALPSIATKAELVRLRAAAKTT